MKMIRSFSWGKPILYILIAVLGGGIGLYALYQNGNEAAETLMIRPGDFVRQVSISGKVIGSQVLDLSFEEPGRITEMYVREGDLVHTGRILASQDTSELRVELAKMEAGIAVQKARLDQLLAGASEADIRIAGTAVKNEELAVARAQQAVEDAKQNLVDTIADAYTKADDAVRGKTDQLFVGPRSGNPKWSVDAYVNSELRSGLEQKRVALESMFTTWFSRVDGITLASALFEEAVYAKSNLEQTKSFLDGVSLAVNALGSNANLTQATIDKWRADVGTARTNVNTAVANLTSALTGLKTKEADIEAAFGDLQKAEDELALKKAPARIQDIALKEAEIRQAETDAELIRVQMARRSIYAPFTAVITAVKLKVGSVNVAHEVAMSLISTEGFEVESFAPELHIPLINVGDPAVVTLDAYGDAETFEAKVASIDPAETVRDGVSTYRIRLQLLEQDDRIKSGMTANVAITTESKSGVIAVPRGAVDQKAGKSFVRIRDGDGSRLLEVTIGSVSSSGQIEIVSGLKDGDVILLMPE